MVSPARLEVIEPGTFFVWEEGYRLIVPIPGEEDRLFAFIRPFDFTVNQICKLNSLIYCYVKRIRKVWMLLAASIVITVISMSLLSWTFNRFSSRNEKDINDETSLMEYFELYFFYIINVLTNHGILKSNLFYVCISYHNPLNLFFFHEGDYLKLTHITSFLFCTIVWLAGASILVYSYSCVVVSSLTVPKMKPTVNSFQDLVASKEVSILIRSDVVMGQLMLVSDVASFSQSHMPLNQIKLALHHK